MPQYSLIVEDSYTNVIDETPEIFEEGYKNNVADSSNSNDYI